MNEEIYSPFADANGNITAYADSVGAIVAEYVYDAFGRIIAQSGTLADKFRHRFSTKYFDYESDLYYYGHRFYSPVLMRWLTRDPIEEGGGLNLNGFCGNNPIGNVDTNGCAFFAYRSLDVPLIGRKFGVHGNTYYARQSHHVVAHEHLFFEDGEFPMNIGYGDDGMFVESDMAGYLSPHSSGWNDCLMREAVKLVKPHPYKMWGAHQYNCQDYAEDLRVMFMELVRVDHLRKKCFCKDIIK